MQGKLNPLSMIDGIKILYEIRNFQNWKVETGIGFNVTTNIDTGEMKQVTRPDNLTGLPYTSIEHRARFGTYQLAVNEITHTGKKTKYLLTIEGSLHKNHFGGKNHSRFTFADVCTQINFLCLNLHLNPFKCYLRTFEYGFNMPVLFNPIHYLEDNLWFFKGKLFDRFKTESQKHIGYECRLSEYRIKVYDKGYQYDVGQQDLMRFEKAYKKMTSPKKLGIITLADLKKPEIYNGLQNELINAWNDVLLFDTTVFKNKRLPVKDANFLYKCKDPKFWKGVKNRTTRQRNKEKFHSLLIQYGSNGNLHDEVKRLLIKEFEKCMIDLDKEGQKSFNNVTVLPSVKSKAKTPECYGFTVNIEGNTVTPVKRYCKGCNKELHPGQIKSSICCSAKYVGEKKAHQCRNNVYNPSNNFRNKLLKIETNGLLFDIQDFFIAQ